MPWGGKDSCNGDGRGLHGGTALDGMSEKIGHRWTVACYTKPLQ